MRKSILLALFTWSICSFAAERPNIIWLMSEDMSLDIECYGMEGVKTPNLNKLAEEGIRFDHCYVTNPICSPSRSAMMIGTHQVKTNSHNHRSNREVAIDPQFQPYTYWLRKQGYTCILGHHGVMVKGRKIDTNFKVTPLGPWDGETQFGLFDKYDNFEKEDQPFFAQIQLKVTHRGDWWTEVREKSEHPVSLDAIKLPTYMADHPAIRLDWAKYLDQVEYMDNEVGMIVDELEQKGMRDNTIIIFIADNGRCNVKGKGYLHDPGLHIPLIIFDPRNPQGRVEKKVVSATDITATILDYAGADVPDYMTGEPIFSPDFKREYVYAARDLWDEVEEESRAVTNAEWKYIRNDKPEVPYDAHQAYLEFYRPAIHVMRTLKEEGKLTEAQLQWFEPTKPLEELYNLKNDPEELNNLAEDKAYAKVLKTLRKLTAKYDKQMKPVSDVYEPVMVNGAAIIEWVKETKPEDYQRMLDGEEIGYKEMGKAYKKAHKK